MIDLESCRIFVDRPKPLFASNGRIRIEGWCFDERSPSPPVVRLSIGARSIACRCGIARSDIANEFPDFPQAANSGFLVEDWMPHGCHSARLEISGDSENWLHAKTITVCAELAPLAGEIEHPEGEEARERNVVVSGWALHPQEPIDHLTLQVANHVFVCDYGLARPDLATRFPEQPESGRCGFNCEISLGPDPLPLRLHARLRSGAISVLSLEKNLKSNDPTLGAFIGSLDEERASLLTFVPAEQPKVSILMPVFNQLRMTTDCLKAIQRHTHDVSYEIILVDDCSDEPAQSALPGIRGITLLRNETNLGFLASCNRAAAAARGDYLLFLNNDTEVRAGWLSALLRVFEIKPDAGLVGAKLIYSDGSLQEAGGIIWRDASGVNYGKFDIASRPEYNYLREVDYCSGACILTPKNLWEQIGGFDREFAPAYYEDTDYAFAVREAGRKVYYQPHATVVHHEGRSCGTSTESGVKSYQVVNAVKFRTKWEQRLALHPDGSAADVQRAKDRGIAKRVLVADARVLCPDQDSGSMRMWNLLLILQELGFKVTFLPGNGLRQSPYTERMQELGIEYLYHPFIGDFRQFLARRAREFDLIVLSRLEIGEKLLDACREAAPGIPVVFDTVDLHFLRGQREAELERSAEKREQAEAVRRREMEIATQCNAVIVVSSFEKEVLEKELPNSHVAIVSNIHRVHESVKPYAGRRDFVFIGGFEHPPNVDAMHWFCAEVLPLITAELPAARLHIVGSKMPKSIRALAGPNVSIHGYVEDVQSFFHSCLLSVAPLRYGAGVKGKVNQSMSYGLPVVATCVAAEGIGLVHEHDVLIADNPELFALQVIRLHRDSVLWSRLSENARQNIQTYFSFEAAQRNLERLLGHLHVSADNNSVSDCDRIDARQLSGMQKTVSNALLP